MAPASTARQIGGKGRVQRQTDSGREILEALRAKLSVYSSEKGPILAEKIEERSEEWRGAPASPGVWCDQCVVYGGTVLQ